MCVVIARRDRTMAAVSVMLDVAFHAGRNQVVSGADIAGRLGLPRRGMEPLLQTLSRVGLLDSTRGPHGGYRLARPARDISLSDIVEAVSAEEPQAPLAGRLHAVVVEKLWGELDDAAVEVLRALTLEDLLRRAARAGLRRPAAEPINFAI
jgi:Rrf2 family transcriptional regulator, iron-sulfur cluster assembly transcription factor